MTSNPPGDRGGVARLAALLPAFEQPGFELGRWEDGGFRVSEAGSEFVAALYESGWVLPGFDWPTWKDSAEARTLLAQPDAIAAAGPHELAKLLTTIVRQERFCEGTLAASHESGLILAILRRARALSEQN